MEKKSPSFDTRLVSIAHAIMFATFPWKILSSLHIAVGVTFHRKFGSEESVDMGNAMGFSCSYAEARTHNVSASLQEEVNLKPEAFV